MKKLITKTIALFIIVILFAACTMVYYNQGLWPVKKGLTTIELLDILDDNPTTEVLEINDNEINKLKVSDNDNNEIKVIIAEKSEAGLSYIVYAFKQDKLFYWGTPLEFSSSDSKLLNDIGIEASHLLTIYND